MNEMCLYLYVSHKHDEMLFHYGNDSLKFALLS